MVRPLTRTEKILLVSLLAIAGLYFYLKKVYDPLMRDFTKQRQEVQTLQSQVAELETIPPTKGLRQRVEKLKADLQRLEAEVRTQLGHNKAQREAEVASTLVELNNLALRHGIEIKGLEYMKAYQPGTKEEPPKKARAQKDRKKEEEKLESPAGDFSWLAFQITLEAGPGQLAGYLRDLGKTRYIAYLQKVEIKTAKEKDKAPRVVLTLLI